MTRAHSNPRRVAGQRVFLDAFRQVGTVRGAASIAGVGRRTVYGWRADPDFARRFEEVRAEVLDSLEEEARRRALHGVEVPVIGWLGRDRRGVIATRREYSDRLLIFLLRRARPEMFGPANVKAEIATSVNITDVTTVNLSTLAAEQLEQLAAILAAAAAPSSVHVGTPKKGGSVRARGEAARNREDTRGIGIRRNRIVGERARRRRAKP